MAIGVPTEDIGSKSNAGAVNVSYGIANNTNHRSQFLYSSKIGMNNETNDQLGRALTAGDFDGDGYCDLVIATPYEDWGSTRDAGMVSVIYGSSYYGLDLNQVQHLLQ